MKRGIAMAAAMLGMLAGGGAYGGERPHPAPPAGAAAGGWGMQGDYGSLFDTKSVGTYKGEIVRVVTFAPKGMAPGEAIVLKTDKGELAVHLGPTWFLTHQDLKFGPKDRIEVKGSKVSFEGKDAIIATEVKKGDQTLTLRSDKGFPLWIAAQRSDAC